MVGGRGSGADGWSGQGEWPGAHAGAGHVGRPGTDALPGAAWSRQAPHLRWMPPPLLSQGGNRQGTELSRGRPGFVSAIHAPDTSASGARAEASPGPGYPAGVRVWSPATALPAAPLSPPHHARSHAEPRAARVQAESGEGWRQWCGPTLGAGWAYWAPDGELRARLRYLHSVAAASADRNGWGSPLGQWGHFRGWGRIGGGRPAGPGPPGFPTQSAWRSLVRRWYLASSESVGPSVVFHRQEASFQSRLLPPAV